MRLLDLLRKDVEGSKFRPFLGCPGTGLAAVKRSAADLERQASEGRTNDKFLSTVSDC